MCLFSQNLIVAMPFFNQQELPPPTPVSTECSHSNSSKSPLFLFIYIDYLFHFASMVKILLLPLKALNGLTSIYLTDLLTLCAPGHSFRGNCLEKADTTGRRAMWFKHDPLSSSMSALWSFTCLFLLGLSSCSAVAQKSIE